jgi:hypothetical protein
MQIGLIISLLIAAASYSRVLSYLEQAHPVIWIDLRRVASRRNILPLVYVRFMLFFQYGEVLAARDRKLLFLSVVALISGWTCILTFAVTLFETFQLTIG